MKVAWVFYIFVSFPWGNWTIYPAWFPGQDSWRDCHAAAVDVLYGRVGNEPLDPDATGGSGAALLSLGARLPPEQVTADLNMWSAWLLDIMPSGYAGVVRTRCWRIEPAVCAEVGWGNYGCK